MQILQNVEMLELNFSPTDREIKFNTDKLRNKKIQSIYITGVPYFGPIYNPPKPNQYLNPTELKNIGLYLNLFNQNGKQIVKELSADNFFVDRENISYINWNINDFLDFEKSHFFYKATSGIVRIAKIRVFITYQTQNFKPFSDEIIGCKTVFYKGKDSGNLHNLVDYSIRDKAIKKITSKELILGTSMVALHLVGKDGRNLDLASSLFLERNSHKEFWLDPIVLDYEKSTFIDETPSSPVPDLRERSITFYY